jgi:DNA-binding response OmpR family regulator
MLENSLLLVDDEPLLRESLAEYLSGAGFNLSQAATEEEAFEVALKTHPSVVVSDLMLGKGSGLSLFSKIKKEMAGKEEPCCILMTGFGTVESAIDAIRVGVDDYLLKPVNLEELNSAVKGGMARRQFLKNSGSDPATALTDRFYHEVSAPLTVLRAYLDMFSEGRFGPLTMVQENKMEVVKRNMQQVVKVLRGFHHRIEDYPVHGKKEALDPAALLREVQQGFFLDFERRGVNVVLGIPSSLPTVIADRRQASMLMEAMIGNCLAKARFGMNMRVRWVQNPNDLSLQFRLEPWPHGEAQEKEFPAFDAEALAAGGLSFESHPDKGLSSLVFLNMKGRGVMEAQA